MQDTNSFEKKRYFYIKMVLLSQTAPNVLRIYALRIAGKLRKHLFRRLGDWLQCKVWRGLRKQKKYTIKPTDTYNRAM